MTSDTDPAETIKHLKSERADRLAADAHANTADLDAAITLAALRAMAYGVDGADARDCGDVVRK